MNIKKNSIIFSIAFSVGISLIPTLNVQAVTTNGASTSAQATTQTTGSAVVVENASTENITSTIGWKRNNGSWYYYKSDNSLATGWIRERNKYYYLYSTGVMATGWISLNGSWYYLRDDGSMATGWITYNGYSYCLDTHSGKMLINTTIDGYAIGSDGKSTRKSNSGSNFISTAVYKGVDVSNYDGTIDFTKVKADGVQCVYMKATQGAEFLDKNLETYYSNAKSAGLKTGFYHYLDGTSSPEEQAQHFYDNIKNKQSDLKPCLDVESTGFDVMDYAVRFAKKFKELSNMDVIIYSYSNFISTNLDSRLSGYSLWEANYNNDPFNLPANSVWYSRAGHQYSDEGQVNGIDTNVDLDEFTQDILQK